MLTALRKPDIRRPSLADAVAQLTSKPPTVSMASDDTTTAAVRPQAAAAAAAAQVEHHAPSSGSAATGNIDVAPAAGAAAVALPPAATAAAGPGTDTGNSPARQRKPNALGSRGRVSTINRVVRSFPNNSDRGATSSFAAGDEERDVATALTAAAGAASNSEGPREEAAEASVTPIVAAVLATDRKLEGLLRAGEILCPLSARERFHGFPRGTPVWDGGDRPTGGSGGGGGDVVSEEAGKGVMRWASRFCGAGRGLLSFNGEEGRRLSMALARHVVRDKDAGLIGTRCGTCCIVARVGPPSSGGTHCYFVRISSHAVGRMVASVIISSHQHFNHRTIHVKDYQLEEEHFAARVSCSPSPALPEQAWAAKTGLAECSKGLAVVRFARLFKCVGSG